MSFLEFWIDFVLLFCFLYYDLTAVFLYLLIFSSVCLLSICFGRGVFFSAWLFVSYVLTWAPSFVWYSIWRTRIPRVWIFDPFKPRCYQVVDYAFYCGKRVGGDYHPMNSGQPVRFAVKKLGEGFLSGIFLWWPLRLFSVRLPIPEAIISVNSFAVLYPW